MASGVLGISPVIAASSISASAIGPRDLGFFAAGLGAVRDAGLDCSGDPAPNSKFRGLLSESGASDPEESDETIVPAVRLSTAAMKKIRFPDSQLSPGAEAWHAAVSYAAGANLPPEPATTIAEPTGEAGSTPEGTVDQDLAQAGDAAVQPAEEIVSLAAARALVAATLGRTMLFDPARGAADRGTQSVGKTIAPIEAAPAELFTGFPQPVENDSAVHAEQVFVADRAIPADRGPESGGLGPADNSIAPKSGWPSAVVASDAVSGRVFEFIEASSVAKDATAASDAATSRPLQLDVANAQQDLVIAPETAARGRFEIVGARPAERGSAAALKREPADQLTNTTSPAPAAENRKPGHAPPRKLDREVAQSQREIPSAGPDHDGAGSSPASPFHSNSRLHPEPPVLSAAAAFPLAAPPDLNIRESNGGRGVKARGTAPDAETAIPGTGEPDTLASEQRGGSSPVLAGFVEFSSKTSSRLVPELPLDVARFAVHPKSGEPRIGSAPDSFSTDISTELFTIPRRTNPFSVIEGKATAVVRDSLREMQPTAAAVRQPDVPGAALPARAAESFPGAPSETPRQSPRGASDVIRGAAITPKPDVASAAPRADPPPQPGGVSSHSLVVQNYAAPPQERHGAANIVRQAAAPDCPAPVREDAARPAESRGRSAIPAPTASPDDYPDTQRTAGPGSGNTTTPAKSSSTPLELLNFVAGKSDRVSSPAAKTDAASPERETKVAENPAPGKPRSTTDVPAPSNNAGFSNPPPAARAPQSAPDSGQDWASTPAPFSPAPSAHGATSPAADAPPPPAPHPPQNPAGADGPSQARAAGERIVELAELRQQTAGREMNIVLRDDALGRIGLRLAERGGVVQTVIRSDSYQGARIISGSLPTLLESLAERGMPVSSQLYGGTGDESQTNVFHQNAGRGRHSRPGAKDGRRSGGAGKTFRLALR